MRNQFTKLFALVAMTICSLTMWAYENADATITWAFTSHSSLSATPSPEDAFLSTNFSYGSNLNTPGTFNTKGCKAGWAEQTLVFFTPKEEVAKNAADAAENMLEWTITPANGITFTPDSVSITACTYAGTGDPQVTIYAVYSDASQETIQTRTSPRRPDKTDQGDGPSVFSKSLTNAVAGTTKIRLYFAGLTNTSKGAAVTNIVVTGTISGTPAASTVYTISTALNIEAAGSVGGAGSYAEGASATLTATPNAGYAFLNWTKAGDAEWTSTTNPITVEVTGDETYTANFKQLYTVAFDEITDYLASTKNPLAGPYYASKDDQFTIPAYAHKYLYGANKTFAEWSDGTNTYQPGDVMTLTDNATLTPVFDATTKTLANITSAFSLTWDLSHAQIEYNNLQGANQQVYYTQVATISGQSVSIPMTIDPTSGKINNLGRSDIWAQVNNGTILRIPAVTGMTFVANAYNAFTTSTTVAGEAITEDMLSNSNKTLTYTYEGSATSIDLVVNGPGYMSTIVVSYPVTEDISAEGVNITGITVDGEAISFPAELNSEEAEFTATWETENIYTTVPVVVASFNEGADETGLVSGTGASRTYTFTKADRTFVLTITNLHIYEPSGEEEAVAIKMNEGSVENNVWTNGVYTFTTSGIGSSGAADFKFDANTDAPYTIAVPADVQVKQFIIRNFHANYSGGNGQLKTVTSGEATTYLPTRRTAQCNVIGGPDNRQYEGEPYDVIVNIENHVAGTPIVFTMLKSAQPMGWIELTTVKVAPTSAPKKTAASVATDDNHAVVAVTFDREIVGEVSASIADKTVKAKGGSTTLSFPVWDLEYAHNYTLTIAAGAAKDAYDNATDAAIEIEVAIPAKVAVVPAEYDYVVSDVTEFLDAIAAVRATNENNANAARKTIFLKNGDYDLGSSNETILWVRAHNLSLIGESRDGVVIHGTSTGISNPVLNLRYWQGFYLQDLTVRNDFDYGTGEFKGVSVATYGGDKTIMKNVRLLSNQDTQVTGHRVYHEDCAIHGTVDFICGGGDNYYYHTDLVLENRGGNVIVAPATSSVQEWGYVFDHCTIKAVDEEAATANADSYYLGRPWQNEPRAYYLHTTMEVEGAAAGWTVMGNLPTHFLEYGSVNGNGDAIDLSGRQNSPTSTNHYSPIMTADSAALFTARNVLGGADAWDAAAKAAQVAAPVVTLNGAELAWEANEEALLYVVLKDGKYLANLTGTSYTLTESGTYSVKAANRFGGLGAASNGVVYKSTATGMEEPTSDSSLKGRAVKVIRNGQLVIIRDGKEYNAQGQMVK